MNAHPFHHQIADAMLPLALRMVSAVRDDDPAELLDATATARAIGGRGWVAALVIVLASLVPDDMTVTELTAWLAPDSDALFDHGPSLLPPDVVSLSGRIVEVA